MSLKSNFEAYKAELERLENQGSEMRLDLELRPAGQIDRLNEDGKKNAKKLNGKFEREYQRWYTEASAVVRQLLPERMAEFVELYKGDGRRKIMGQFTYNIQDWMTGYKSGIAFGEKNFDDYAVVTMKFNTQLDIFKSVNARFESGLLNIKQIVQADLFDTELDTAQELLKHGFGRGGGAVAGVVLEKHLSEVAANHKLKLRKKKPSLNDYNDLLRNNGVLEVPTWRQIQRLADIRNLCVHNKQKEPIDEEVAELIGGVEKLTKSLY